MVSADQAEPYLLACTSIVRDLITSYQAEKDVSLNDLRNKYSKKYKIKGSPRLVDILSAVPEEWRDRLRGALRAKPVRTASGIAVVAVMCKPHRCPHVAMTGNICVYCPGGPDSDFEYSTQSYTGYEPTSMRAIRARYDPYEQARGRIDQLRGLGHSVDKVEIIIMGGTFMSMPEDYRHKFVAGLHNALSGYTGEDIDEAVKYSERSRTKCVGITIETRPDYCLKPHLSQMLRYGCTRLEIGVQSVYEDVARDTNRGHTVRSVTESFHLAKDAGYKIVAHMMPDLPNCGVERDIWQFQEFFENPAFRSDGLKLYPTLVIRGTGLYELWRMGKYKNYTPNALVDIVARILALVPPWTRVYRVQRDIPMPLVSSGVENGNLRQLALERMKDFGAECRDVRYREVGMSEIHQRVRPQSLELLRRDYTANAGWETFLSYEDPEQDILVGLLRLRKCSEEGTYRKELTGVEGGCSIVRELHVYGTAVGVHSRDPKVFQHQGIGTLLMEEAERIAREEHGSGRIAVISGVGTRDYYRRLGYKLDGPYMVKDLEPLEGDEDEEEDEEEQEAVEMEVDQPAPAAQEIALLPSSSALVTHAVEDSTPSGPSQSALAAALSSQSSFRSKSKPVLTSFQDLTAGGDAKVATCGESSGGCKRKIYCMREGCGSLILNDGVAEWVVGEGGVLPTDPAAPFPPDQPATSSNTTFSNPTAYWHVTGVPMCFENIGFTRTSDTEGIRPEGKIKWLICAECDLGPLGWCYEGGTEAWLAVNRVKYGPVA